MEFQKQGKYLIFIEDELNKLKYDLATKEFFKTTNGKERKVKHPQKFFRGHHYDFIISLIDTNHKDFMKFIHKQCDRLSNVGSFLQKMSEFHYVESWCYFGYEKHLDVEAMKNHTPKSIGKKAMSLLNKINEEIKDDRRWIITGENRYSGYTIYKKDLMNYVLSMCINDKYKNLMYSMIEHIREQEYFNDDMEILHYLKSNRNSIIECIEKYECKYDKLLDYMILKIESMENYGYKAWSDYLDFLDMQYRLIGKIKEKYPKFLKSNHDVMVRVFNEYQKEHKEDIFAGSINQSLYCDKILNKKYKIVLPKITQDLKDEGLNLGHCVASYIDSIMQGKRQVIFLRNIENLDESLLTLDIKNDKIVQCEGKSRRNPNKEELKAISQYCKIKNIKEAF